MEMEYPLQLLEREKRRPDEQRQTKGKHGTGKGEPMKKSLKNHPGKAIQSLSTLCKINNISFKFFIENPKY